MFPTFKKWFIPSEENSYLPHFVRAVPVALFATFVGALFVFSSALQTLLVDEDSFLAAVVSSVLVDLTNADRNNEGIHGLSVNPVLVEAAQAKANHMASNGYFSHNSPDGKTPWYWFGQAGYEFAYAGENLAVFFGDSEDVARAWMNSPSHRANILNSNFTEIGIATAEGYYQGSKTVFVVQMFGTPTTKRALATLTTEPTIGAETTPEGEVGGESAVAVNEDNTVVEEPTVIHEDDMFIAVKNEATLPAPSTEPVEAQTTALERLVASPQTLLSYVYGVLAVVVVLALILLVFLEATVQRPINIIFTLFLLAFIGILFFVSQDNVALAQTTSGVFGAGL